MHSKCPRQKLDQSHFGDYSVFLVHSTMCSNLNFQLLLSWLEKELDILCMLCERKSLFLWEVTQCLFKLQYFLKLFSIAHEIYISLYICIAYYAYTMCYAHAYCSFFLPTNCITFSSYHEFVFHKYAGFLWNSLS